MVDGILPDGKALSMAGNLAKLFVMGADYEMKFYIA